MQSILVVEDDSSVRNYLALMLEAEGFSVRTASTAARALEIVQECTIDLITIDLGLPDMPGMELAARLRARPETARARQIIVSGDTPSRGEAFSVDAVLGKPFDFCQFLAAVRRVAALPVDGDLLAVELDRILSDRLVFPHYQPIVELASGRVVGCEALTRGPPGSPLRMPDALFGEAQRCGRLTELDMLCSIAATAGIADFGSHPGLVFINVEPSTLAQPFSSELQAASEAVRPFRVVAEYTERAVTRQLPALLRHAAKIRRRGDLVALDDLGLDPNALAMLPLIAPEIVKLDLSLVQGPLTEVGATVAVAVAAYAERSGALVIAEGIETDEQLAAAHALGAHLGQGFLFGAATPPSHWPRRAAREFIQVATVSSAPDPCEAATPFTLVAREHDPKTGSATLVAGVSQQLSAQAQTLAEQAASFVLAPDHRALPHRIRTAWLGCGGTTAVLGMLGVGITCEQWPGAYTGDLHPDEPMAGEWAAVVIGPHQATVLCARELTHEPDINDRSFEFVVSHDRELAIEVAALLARRIDPRVPPGHDLKRSLS